MATRMSMDEYNRRLMVAPDDSAKHDALYDTRRRIQELEKLNALLAEQVDRMRPVVSAAGIYRHSSDEGRTELTDAVDVYERQMTQLAREGE